MFREMRRQDRKMTDKEAIELLIKGEYGVLSTIGKDLYAYGVPLSYAYVDGAIYFHCANEGQKLDNINDNNKVSFCVVADTRVIPEKFTTNFESVIVFGKAQISLDDEKRKGLLALVEKYSPDFIEKGTAYMNSDINKTTVFKIDIEHISGKARK